MQTVPPAGAALKVPADGTITAWRVRGAAAAPGTVTLRVMRPQAGGQFKLVGRSAAAANLDGITPNLTTLPVEGGDQIGVTLQSNNVGGAVARIDLVAAAGATWTGLGALNDGTTATPSSSASAGALLINATVTIDPPVVTLIGPTSGLEGGGTRVTITGRKLAKASSVLFGGVPAPSFSAADDEVTAVAPPHAPGAVDVQVVTPGGTSSPVPLAKFTYRDVTKPGISRFRLSPASFRAALKGGSIAKRRGGKVSFRLSEAGNTAFRVERAAKGRRAKGRCRKPSRGNRTGRRCTRYVRVRGSFTKRCSPGANSLRFTGRIRGRRLRPGRYRLVAQAADGARNRSLPARRKFRVKR